MHDETWQQALQVQASRVRWCAEFGEVLATLAKHGAPPPDDVCAGHADWASQSLGGVIRVGRVMRNSVMFLPPHGPSGQHAFLRESVEHGPLLALVLERWAQLLTTYATPRDPARLPYTSATDPAAPHTDHERLEQNRHQGYWDPNATHTYFQLRNELDRLLFVLSHVLQGEKLLHDASTGFYVDTASRSRDPRRGKQA